MQITALVGISSLFNWVNLNETEIRFSWIAVETFARHFLLAVDSDSLYVDYTQLCHVNYRVVPKNYSV